MDYQQWAFWINVGQIVAMVLLAAATWVTNRTKANKSAIEKISNDVSQLKERVSVIENDVEHLPTHDDIKRTHQRLDTVSENLREIQGEFRAVRETLVLIHTYLLNSKGEKG